MTEHDGFTVERDTARATATVTLAVPGKFNRVSMAARDQLRAAFEELDRDEAIRFVVLTGADGAFTAGGDIPGFLERSPWHVSRLADNVAAPERCTKPVVAALRGYTFGVGLELVFVHPRPRVAHRFHDAEAGDARRLANHRDLAGALHGAERVEPSVGDLLGDEDSGHGGESGAPAGAAPTGGPVLCGTVSRRR